jgi:hypothetical protein
MVNREAMEEINIGLEERDLCLENLDFMTVKWQEAEADNTTLIEQNTRITQMNIKLQKQKQILITVTGVSVVTAIVTIVLAVTLGG